MKIYYAHCIAIYDTPQEQRDLNAIRALRDFFGATGKGIKIINPNAAEHHEGYKRGGIDYFRCLAASCDVVVFRALPDGAIPSGVAAEIRAAQQARKIIIELPSAIARRTIDVNETREYLAEIGQR